MAMLECMENLTEEELLHWLRSSAKSGSHIFSHGYQGHVYLYEHKGERLILKAPTGWGVGRLIRQAMLRNEYRVYSRLSGMEGVPRCYGLLRGRYLVLQWVDGIPFRRARIVDPEIFFRTLLDLIKRLHRAGVAHGDLKKKDNLLVIDGRRPCLVDFGVAVIKKPGFSPLNGYLFNLARRFDFNAWAKLKYGRRLEAMSREDRDYYRRTLVEKVARRVKRAYRGIRKGLGIPHRRHETS